MANFRRVRLLMLLFMTAASTLQAQNPIVQTCFTTDPAPLSVGDSVLYVFTGHDEDKADFFWMQEWRVYSTRDMVNWTDHGSPLALESFSWADDRAWASQCIERNGKFYWYICAHSKLSGGMAIGVAVANRPEGPYRDALGRPLYENGSWDHIDPTVWIDEKTGQAWVMWGNPRVYALELQDDMIHTKGDVHLIDMTEEGFGSPLMNQREKGKKYRDSYVEGPWLMQRNNRWLLLYAAGGVPEHIAYSSADNPLGPWHYEGEIMPLGGTDSFTNHCGVTDFRGHSYFFYHTGWLPGGGGFGRSTSVEEFQYTADGKFPTITPTREGVKPIANFCSFRRVEAETMAFSKGVHTTHNDQTGVYVSDIHNGDWIKLQSVDLGAFGARKFTVRAASALRGGTIELHIDSVRGLRLGTVEITGTGGWEQWRTFDTFLPRIATGIHDLYLTFHGRKGPHLFNLDWWQLDEEKNLNLPILQTHYTADPSPLVIGDTLFLYVSHDSHADEIMDARERNSAGFFMYDWLLYSTTDMVNWTDHGPVASLRDFSWRGRDNGAWAVQCVERNGKYYLYCPLHGHGIGVLVADSPYGPFKDPLGKPLVWQREHWDDIDPTVYIDKEGQAWMYWGNPNTYYVRLGKDMISTEGDIVKLDYHIDHYQEGPWLYERNNHWYLAYASTCCPEGIGYAMGDSPQGPWQCKGYLMAPTPRDRGNHPGIADFKGKTYLFGQDYDLLHFETKNHFERRSVSVAEMTYNADGTVNEVPYWLDHKELSPVGNLNPYRRVEAETMAWGYGLRTEKVGIAGTRELVSKARGKSVVDQFAYSTGHKNLYVYDLNAGEYIRLRSVDFGKKAPRSFALSAAAAPDAKAVIAVCLDSAGGQQLCTITIDSTGSVDDYRQVTAQLKSKIPTGVHDLYLCILEAKGDVRLDWWQFKK